MNTDPYVHGYSQREGQRLNDQADTLEQILHHDSLFAPGSKVLEAGCGVGAQSKIISRMNPQTRFISVDISEKSIDEARKMELKNVQFFSADIFNLPFEDQSFDAVLVCFVLEHLAEPLIALTELKRVLKPGGRIMVIEGDHGSAYFHPDSKFAQQAINCQVSLQKKNGGNSNIGRELFPLLNKAGFSEILVSPRMVYVDSGRPNLVDGFTRNTFTAMIEGVREQAIAEKLINREEFDRGINDLYRTAEEDGVFCYTFFKGVGSK